jgi:CPA2 family monovalent cation:H+ antiporter-2
MLVLSISDLRAQQRIIRLAREMNASLRIVTVARGVDEIGEAARLGSDRVVSLEFESALEVMQEVLETFHVPRNVIRAQLRALRGEDYSMLRARRLSEGVSQAVLDALVQGTTEVARLAQGSPAVGQTLSQLHLRRESGASVIAVVRDGTSMANPSADLELREGDDLVLVGGHAQVDSALALIRPRS